MKKLMQIQLKIVLTLLLTSSLFGFFSDVTLPKITGVKKIVEQSSVGLEWNSVAQFANIGGINIYRAKAKPGANQTYVKIGSIGNRFATHYVDMNIKPNTKYFYTLTTYSGLNESLHGDIIAVKTRPPYKQIKLVSAIQVSKNIVKILWVPSSQVGINQYIIQRKQNNSKWFYLTTIKGRLYPEYVDTSVKRGHKYSYRIIAVDGYNMTSVVSNPLEVEVK